MTLKIGDTIPDAKFHIMTDDGPGQMSTADLLDGKKVVLIGVPGAFTPTCHANHLPGFIENLDAIKAKGIDEVAVTTVNDVHVVGAWAKASNAVGKIHFLADGNGDFAKSIGLDVDLGIAGMGVRSKRYAMIIENGVVKELNVEPAPGQADTSSAATILSQL